MKIHHVVPTVECRSVIIPPRGRSEKTVKHRVAFPMEIRVLTDAEAPIAVDFTPSTGRSFLVSSNVPSSTALHMGRLGSSEIRVSPRGLPAIPAFNLADVRDLSDSMSSELLYRRFGNDLRSVAMDIGLEAREVISSNAELVRDWILRRQEEMFVVGDLVYAEAPAPVVVDRKSVVNDFIPKAGVLSGMSIVEFAPGIIPEGVECNVKEVSIGLPSGFTMVRAIVRALPAVLSEYVPHLTGLAGELARASGIADARIDLYDWRACRDIVGDISKAAYKTNIATSIATVIDSGVLDRDILVDLPKPSHEDEQALSMGF
jgi:hypothetical protein